MTWNSAFVLPLLVLLATGSAAAQDGAATVAPVLPGAPFPAAVYGNLNAAAGGPARIDLAQVLGKKPIILHYWIAGNLRAEKVFQEMQSLVDELGHERIVLYGVAVPRPHIDADAIRHRLNKLGIKVPVLDDEGFKIGQMLRISSVPNVTIIDRSGRMQLTNGASLSQVLGYKVDLEQAIRRTTEKGELMAYGYLDRYFPVKELEGQPCPDFKAPLLTTSVEQRYHSLLDDQKLNVLIFWSVDCPHCRESLPEINEWLKLNPDEVNVISAAHINDEASKTKTLEFCRANDFRFPTLVDQGSEIGTLYRVTTTPTIFFIGPDGVVDSALVSGYSSFGEAVKEKKRKLVKG